MTTPVGARILDKTISTGLGDLVLAGEQLREDTQSFHQWAGGADQLGVPYAVILTDAALWESGIGNYRHATKTLERATPLKTSSGLPISWPRGTKMVWVDLPAAEIMLRRDNLDGVSASAGRATLELGSAATRAVGTDAASKVPDRDAADSRYSQIGALDAPSGTKLLFPGGAVPAGWTREDQAEDFALLGAKAGETIAAEGGDWNPAATFTVAGTAVTLAQVAEHAHELWHDLFEVNPFASHGGSNLVTEIGSGDAISTAQAGSSQSHAHGVSDSELWRPAHKRAIVGVKN